MKSLLPFLVLCLAISPLTFASHKGTVIIPEITLKHPEAQVTVKVDAQSAKLEAIEVIIEGKKITLEKEELAGIDKVDIRSVRIMTSFGQGNYESRSKLTDQMIIAFEFGPRESHVDEEKGEILPVYSVARFYFKSSKYTYRWVAKPIGDYKNKWNLFEKEPGTKEVPDGTDESPEGPSY